MSETGSNPEEFHASEQLFTDEAFDAYKRELTNEVFYLQTMDGDGFELTEQGRRKLHDTERRLSHAERMEAHGYKHIEIEAAPEELAGAHPELFADTKSGFKVSETETEDTIAGFDFDSAKAKLDALPFANRPSSQGRSKQKLQYAAPRGDHYQIPVDRIVGAGGFVNGDMRYPDSWAGRDSGYGDKSAEDGESQSTERSLNVIIRYAQKGIYDPSKSGPVNEVDVMYGSDGEVYYYAGIDNHRIAAAKLRGDKTIPVGRITMYPKDDSLLSEYVTESFYEEESH